MSDRHRRDLQSDRDATFRRMGEAPPDSTASFLGRIAVETTLPTAAGRVFMVNPVEIDGGRSEGDAATLTADSARLIPAVVIGAKAPALGDHVDVYGVGGRWVAETGCGTVRDDCPGGGTLCVTLVPTCAGDGDGYTVVVKDHGSGAVVATGTTASDTVCFTVPVGSYDVTAARSGCVTLSWADQAVACGETTTLGGQAKCATGAAIVFTILGCHNHPLPDAVITITGPESGTITTGGDGKATFYVTHTGTYSFTITHPSGRFASSSGTVTKGSLCTAGAVDRTMSPAAGYNCCAEFGSYWPAANPYPIPNNLFITDGQGFTMPVAVDAGSCQGLACAMREMDNASPSPEAFYSCRDGNPGGAFVPPPDIGTYSTSFFWDLKLGAPGTMLLRQHYPISSATGLAYVANGDATGVCAPQDSRRMWRLVQTCANGNSFTQYSTTQTSLTVNSVYPLNISFTFTAGPDGFGPVPVADSVSGIPYTLSAVVHE